MHGVANRNDERQPGNRTNDSRAEAFELLAHAVTRRAGSPRGCPVRLGPLGALRITVLLSEVHIVERSEEATDGLLTVVANAVYAISERRHVGIRGSGWSPARCRQIPVALDARLDATRVSGALAGIEAFLEALGTRRDDCGKGRVIPRVPLSLPLTSCNGWVHERRRGWWRSGPRVRSRLCGGRRHGNRLSVASTRDGRSRTAEEQKLGNTSCDHFCIPASKRNQRRCLRHAALRSYHSPSTLPLGVGWTPRAGHSTSGHARFGSPSERTHARWSLMVFPM